MSLSWYKNNGFGMGNDINGEWTITAEVPQNTTSHVEFYLDDHLEFNDSSAPFSWNFNTTDYPEGTHNVKAVSYSTTGETATTAAERNFVGFPVASVVGIIVLIVVVFAVTLVVTWFWIKKKANEKRGKIRSS